ncbi:MAG: PfkB family carbohydrate kinase [Planctomycetota bacterium]|nr:PfkB family carbohydrate kinase [Planctomycetota bacterium]
MVEVLGVGEWLWDMLPEGARPGGAPYNLAFQVQAMGRVAGIISRLGDDEAGQELCQLAAAAGVDLACAQIDSRFPTGKVLVERGPEGEPVYSIMAPAAWDFLQADERIFQAAKQARVIVFGTLAQRNHVTHQAIGALLAAAKETCRIFDVNLRQGYHSPELLREGLALARWLKVNTDELHHLATVLSLQGPCDLELARAILHTHDLDLVAITDAAHGAMLVTPQGAWRVDGHTVTGGDPVGAGDAFTAGLIVRHLEGANPEQMLAFANALAACVAGETGGTPIIARPRVEALAEKLPVHDLGRATGSQ